VRPAFGLPWLDHGAKTIPATFMIPFSVLDLAPITVGADAGLALRRTQGYSSRNFADK
jgi:hypothetical protein